jgi:hypothetical protein
MRILLILGRISFIHSIRETAFQNWELPGCSGAENADFAAKCAVAQYLKVGYTSNQLNT